MRTRYRIDDYQRSYFVVPDFATLLRTALETDFAPLYARLAGLPEIEPEAILPDDVVVTRGTQARAA